MTIRLMPLQEAASTYGVDRVTLHRYIRRGKLAKYQRSFDKRTYVDAIQIEALLEPRRVDVRRARKLADDAALPNTRSIE